MLMGKIYEKARGTIVWLGEEDGDKEALSGMVKLLEPHPSNTAKDDINLLKSYLDSKDKKTQGSSQRQALVRLLNRSWFSRAWIFQEAVKSSCISMICGGMKIPFEVLVRLSQATFELEEAERGYAHSLAKSTIGFDTLYLIEHTRPRGCRDSNCERQKLQTGFLGLLMQALQQFEATKQHDLIYAFLAFAGTVTIIPDYGAPVSLTWRDATANIIAATKSLEVFAAVRADARCAFNLPSWVPDWSACYPHARPICAPDFASNFRACDSLPGPQPATHIWEDAPPETLIVQGCTIGTISYISPPNFEGAYYRDTGGLEGVLQLKMHVDPLRRHLGLEPPSHAQHLLPDIEDRLTRTMLADGAFGHNTQPIPDRMRDITSLCKSEEQLEQEIRAAGSADLSPRLASRRDFLERLRQWSLVVQRKKIFLCRRPDGRLDLGLAPSSVKRGDVICLLRGSRVPIVLRPADEGGGDRWRVIGQCYLDGWMYGKVPAGGEREIVGLDRFIVV